MDHGFGVNLFGRYQWKAFAQVEPHLVPESAERSHPGAVFSPDPGGPDPTQKIKVGFHCGAKVENPSPSLNKKIARKQFPL